MHDVVLFTVLTSLSNNGWEKAKRFSDIISKEDFEVLAVKEVEQFWEMAANTKLSKTVKLL